MGTTKLRSGSSNTGRLFLKTCFVAGKVIPAGGTDRWMTRLDKIDAYGAWDENGSCNVKCQERGKGSTIKGLEKIET